MGRQFATLRADGSVYYPPTFDRSEEPYRVFSAPLMLYADGTRNPGRVPAGGGVGWGAGGFNPGRHLWEMRIAPPLASTRRVATAF